MNLNNNKNGYELKITARTYEEARDILFKRFGTGYTITQKKPVLKGGFLGFGQHEEVEFTYIINNRSETPSAQALSSQNEYSSPMERYLAPNPTASFAKNKEELLNKLGGNNSVANAQIKELGSYLEDLKSAVDKVTQISQFTPQTVSNPDTHETITKIQGLLSKNEFSFEYINYITGLIKKNFSLEDLNDYTLVQNKVIEWIGETLRTYVFNQQRKPHVVILVGPTGVGKTTTLIKLAARYFREHNKTYGRIPQIKFVSTDAMRVGAFEQLRNFGNYFYDQPNCVLKAESLEDLQTIYDQNCNSVDAFFIDTSGYSPNDASHIGNMKDRLSIVGNKPEIYLVVTASTKASDLHIIMQNYEIFGYNSVIVSKCDESSHFGNVISVLHERHKSVSFITDGQNAAKNLSEANIISFLTKLEGFELNPDFREYLEDKFGEK